MASNLHAVGYEHMAPIGVIVSRNKCHEIWVNAPDGQAICALINDDLGWLMYLRHKGDAGFSSRNHKFDNGHDYKISYVLSNGQEDEYPVSWALPLHVVQDALEYFRTNHRPPDFVQWHNDSSDGVELPFTARP